MDSLIVGTLAVIIILPRWNKRCEDKEFRICYVTFQIILKDFFFIVFAPKNTNFEQKKDEKRSKLMCKNIPGTFEVHQTIYLILPSSRKRTNMYQYLISICSPNHWLGASYNSLKDHHRWKNLIAYVNIRDCGIYRAYTFFPQTIIYKSEYPQYCRFVFFIQSCNSGF